MKRLYQFVTAIVLCAMGLPIFVNGQMVADSVEMGAGYANDIYYSMENGEIASVDRTNWDIAFYTNTFSAGVIINEGKGLECTLYPNADTTGWDNVDTTGHSTWPVLYNSPEMWEEGAFNRHSLSDFDYGWGVYNPINHNVVGDSIYILTWADGSAKKLWIERKISMQNIYEFKYADIDGSNVVTETLNCYDYAEKNFVYYSMQTQEVLDREPAKDSWDFICTKYITMYNGDTPYPVTGVLMNVDVPANRFDMVGSDFNDWSSIPFDSTKVPIGYDWKYFDMSTVPPGYVVEDSIAFFVSDRNTNVYKLVFTAFDYMSGKFVFEKSLISPAGFGKTERAAQFSVYPNPAANFVSLETTGGIIPEAITILDLSGRTIVSTRGTSPVTRLDLSGIPGGMYLIRVSEGSEQYIQKLVIRRN